jgi:hypothetical protein
MEQQIFNQATSMQSFFKLHPALIFPENSTPIY